VLEKTKGLLQSAILEQGTPTPARLSSPRGVTTARKKNS